MLRICATIAFLVLVPLSAFANRKEKGTTKLHVVTARTQVHDSSSGDKFTYTDLMFTEINGKKAVYECAQKGDVCPILEAGETYTVDQDGAVVYVPMTSPEGKKDTSAKFKQVGSW
jgi:hypothetical protein